MLTPSLQKTTYTLNFLPSSITPKWKKPAASAFLPKSLFTLKEIASVSIITLASETSKHLQSLPSLFPEKRQLTPFFKCPEDCPARTHPIYYYVDGENRCTCPPVWKRWEPYIASNECEHCPTGLCPYHFNDGDEQCVFWPQRAPGEDSSPIPYAE